MSELFHFINHSAGNSHVFLETGSFSATSDDSELNIKTVSLGVKVNSKSGKKL